jgi:hypothetical protein
MTLLAAGWLVGCGPPAIPAIAGELTASGGVSRWACSSLSGGGACLGAGRCGRNSVRAVTKASSFEAMFSP